MARPSKIDAIIGVQEIKDPQGNVIEERPITIADRVIAYVRAGEYVDLAAAAAGINRDTIYEWMKQAATAQLRQHNQPNPTPHTPHEIACIEFSDAITRARGEWAAAQSMQLEQLSRGGLPQVTTTEIVVTKADGKTETKTTTTTTHTLPDARVIMWRMERRLQDYYGPRVEMVDKRGEDLLTDGEAANAVADSVEAFLAGRESAQQEAAEKKPKRAPRKRSAPKRSTGAAAAATDPAVAVAPVGENEGADA